MSNLTNRITPSRSLLVAVAAGLLTVSGCASRYKLDAEAPTYAAEAKIKVKVNKTDNREVRVVVDHLAPPKALPGNVRGYMVWINVPGHGVTKAGMLDYNEKRRRGKLLATTPHSKFEVFITLETDGSPTVPSQQVVLRKVVGRT